MIFKTTKISPLIWASFLFLFLVVIGTLLIYRKYSGNHYAFDVDKETEVMWSEADRARKNIEDIPRRMRESDISNRNVVDTQAIKLIKEKGFEDIAEKPVDPFKELAEKEKARRQTYVKLHESDLKKHIVLSTASFDNMKIKEYQISSQAASGYQMIYAPCDYIVFKSSPSWIEFINNHKVREKINPDFSKENVVVIVSKSELPPGIFRVKDVSFDKKTAFVNFYVDVFEISEENPEARPNFYSAVKVPKGFDIKLRQIR